MTTPQTPLPNDPKNTDKLGTSNRDTQNLGMLHPEPTNLHNDGGEKEMMLTSDRLTLRDLVKPDMSDKAKEAVQSALEKAAHEQSRVMANDGLRDCIFCNLDNLKNGYRLHENSVVSFVPLNPVVEGHICVMPIDHVDDISDNSSVTARVMKVVAEIVEQYPQCNVITSKGKDATQSINHLHIHIVPRAENDNLALPWTDREAYAEHCRREGELAAYRHILLSDNGTEEPLKSWLKGYIAELETAKKKETL